jgi:hypothetical protein
MKSYRLFSSVQCSSPDASLLLVRPSNPVRAGLLLGLLALTGLSRTAAAAEPAPSVDPTTTAAAPEEEPKILLVAQPAPSGNDRTFHRHDGFYLRANFGLSLMWANLNDQGSEDFDVEASGSGVGLDLLIGGSPSAGIALGGGIISNWSFGADFESEGTPVPDRDLQDLTIGVFVDGFPVATGPWHLGALVGLSGVNVNQDNYVQSTAGLGGALWAGYDQWVADDWALGGQLRLTLARTVGEENDFDVSASTATLGVLFSALYH